MAQNWSEDNSSDQPLELWKVKTRHREEASQLGLDINIVEHKFREQMHFEHRTTWDSTFWQYLDATSVGREEVEFPQGICDFDNTDIHVGASHLR
jgi:hypothetical protein